ncbi:conserved hypothetical protein [Vibrio crassostreae]|nr:conserved hypothetical protein [Vibrio crassostreae]CAK1783652.1 conserved hypothetical protein [Vibrio crassostreae]CAK2290601.1 conserved hypothetical protein [Vibrio crassostreae]CAK2748642.1 conserved hypothetical protein [Vibrio crassostreae]
MMSTVTVNTNEMGAVIAIGNVNHSNIAHKHSVNSNELPDDIREHLGVYHYVDGVFEKVTIINEAEERHWQQTELAHVNAAIAEYQADMAIEEQYSELRAGTYTEEDYFKLLGDRKLLIEYVQQADFPECGRPKLSVSVR